jgi:hypothetical protein
MADYLESYLGFSIVIHVTDIIIYHPGSFSLPRSEHRLAQGQKNNVDDLFRNIRV